MKAICPTCEQAFQLCSVTFAEESEVIQEKGGGFCLIPKHPAAEGKPTSAVVSSSSGKVLEKICNGSLRPTYLTVH